MAMFSGRSTVAFLVSTLLLASDTVHASLPQVDFNRMGKVGLVGGFAGLEFLDNSTAIVNDPSTSTLLLRTADGSLTHIGSTDAGGKIVSGCALGDTFYFAGLFKAFNGTAATNIASYTSSTKVISSLGTNGPNGEINSLYCDVANSKIWTGGKFTSPGSAVAVWDANSKVWSKAPFSGLTGASAQVNSIIPDTSSSSLLFAGSFITSFEGNVTSLNSTNNPNVPYSPGATPFSSSLVPVPLGNADINASPSSSDPQYNDIKNTLCPKGSDGPGNSWFAADGGNTAVIIVRTYMSLSTNGVRLGNTFQPGHGTTSFSVETLPDNTIQTFRYLDPASGQNKTCSQPCPLLTDPSILYQDFLFSGGSTNITGIQIKISSYTGTSAGLHILQLLSSGAFAAAVPGENGVSCYAPNPSNVTRTGTWTQKTANTNIPATVQTIFVSMLKVGTSAANGPSFTWMPYVSASGMYDISILIPGCNDFQDCELRTTVKIVVFPGGGQSPVVTIVDQRNGYDTTKLIYSGPVVPSSSSFDATITMTLADEPVGQGQNGQYEIVADRIQLVLTSANLTGATQQGTPSSTGNRTATGQTGFGFFEYVPGSIEDATSSLSNTSRTALDTVGIALLSALGGSGSLSSTTAGINTLAKHASGDIFIGGSFKLTSGMANGGQNLVVYRNGALSRLAGNGLNGNIAVMLLVGDELFVGGSFSDTSSPTMNSLRNIAMYDVREDKWIPLQAGVNGPVTDLNYADGKVQVTGNFTSLLANAGGVTIYASGFAIWNVLTKNWAPNGGFLVGAMTLVANETSLSNQNSKTQIIAGNIETSLTYGSPGFITIQNGEADPKVTSLGVNLGTGSAPSSTVTARELKSHIRRAAKWFTHMDGLNQVFGRQSTTQLSPLPMEAEAVAPAVLAGAFWTNSTSSKQVVVIGGNFSYISLGVQSAGVAIYDTDDMSLTSLIGPQVSGTVRTLLVQDNLLFIGGDFAIPGSNSSSFAIYNLLQQNWEPVVPSLDDSGGSVVVRSLSASPTASGTVFVAGSFSSKITQCYGICAWDILSRKWKALGSGIQGDVASVAYGGSNQEYLFAAGSILLRGASANVAQYTVSNDTWQSVGSSTSLPGPITAVEVNGGNISSMFAAGRSLDNSSTFLSFWNGLDWTPLPTTLQIPTEISQLAMVPLQATHSSNSIVEADRMLLISGSLVSSTYGLASSALFDGVNYIPYIMTTDRSGKSGFVSALFHSMSTFSFSQRSFLATGVVILISIAIAAGFVFLLALIGILWTLFSRREDPSMKFEGSDDDDDSTHHRPSSLLEHINAATRTTILGASPFGLGGDEKYDAGLRKGDLGADNDPFSADAGQFVRNETPSEGMHHAQPEDSRAARVRYSFDGAEEGELPLAAGAEIEILDDKDPAWWYVRDSNGKEGVVPAAYLY